MILGYCQHQGIGGLRGITGTAGDGKTANMRHFSRGTVGPKSLMVSCEANWEISRTGRHNVLRPRLSFILVRQLYKMTGRDGPVANTD